MRKPKTGYTKPTVVSTATFVFELLSDTSWRAKLNGEEIYGDCLPHVLHVTAEALFGFAAERVHELLPKADAKPSTAEPPQEPDAG